MSKHSRLTLNSCQAACPLSSAVMATKSQHAERYRLLPPLLRALREEAGLTQRDLAGRIARPQSWVYNCETANRRVDVTEFIAWSEACGVDPRSAFARLLGPGEPDAPPWPGQDPVNPR
jgi:hypothetical protein